MVDMTTGTTRMRDAQLSLLWARLERKSRAARATPFTRGCVSRAATTVSTTPMRCRQLPSKNARLCRHSSACSTTSGTSLLVGVVET